MEKKVKGWKIATIIIAIITVAAITTLSIFLGNISKDRAALGGSLENMYQRAYYELVANINNIEIGFSKLMITSSKPTQIELLNDIAKNSHLAGVALSTLSAENYGVLNTTRYVNQTGDFAIYLVNELSRGNEITQDDKDILERLYQMTRDIGDTISDINNEIAKGEFNFTDSLKEKDNVFGKVFMDLEESIVNYPALIYDGPFSTALLEKEAKALTGDDITEEEGVTIIRQRLEEFNIKDIKFTGKCESHFTCFSYMAKTEKDEEVNIDLTVKGGHMVMFNVSRSVNEPKYKPEECAELAEQYLIDLGYSDMKSVWVSNYNSIIYVNLAPIVNDVVWYPDLVKVKISSNDGELIGVESLSYIYNHTERNLSKPFISESQARANISTDINVETSRMALIPYKKGNEVLTYEFSGRSSDDSLYYIYVDVLTGEEVQILRVIDSDEGTLLL